MLITVLMICGLLLGIYLLIKSSDLFVANAIKLGNVYNLSPFLVGFVLIALGTSLPELFSSIIAVLRGTSEFVLGNVVGSNIANIGIILGVSIIMAKKFSKSFTIHKKALQQDALFAVCALILITVFILTKSVTYIHGIVLLIFLTFVLWRMVKNPLHKPEICHETFSWKLILFIIGGGIGIYVSSELIIYTVIRMVELIPLFADSSFIGLTIVALGTSLPELSVSLAALKQKAYTLIIGNVLGSNMINILFVVGISALIGPLAVTTVVVYIALPFLIIMTLLMLLFMYTSYRLDTWEGIVLLVLYGAFIVSIFGV